MPLLRFAIQLVLCVVVLGAGVAGFKILKDGSLKPPVEHSETADTAGTSSTPTGTDSPPKAGENASVNAQAESDQAQTAPRSDEPEQQESAEAGVWPVSVVTAKRDGHAPALQIYGSVEAPRETQLTSGVNADVTNVTVLEGQDVAQGDVLVELDGADLRLAIAQRRAELEELAATVDAERRRHQANVESLQSEREILELSRRQLDRYTKLAARQIGTKSAADDAARTVRQQELAITSRQNAIDAFGTTMAGFDARESRIRAQIEQAERDLERTRIVAPFNGRVTRVSVSPGNRVRSGEPIATIYDTGLVEIRAQIPNRLVPQIQSALDKGMDITGTGELEGQTIDVRLDRYAARTRTGSGSVDALLRVTGDVSPQLGRTVEVTLNLPQVPDSLAIPAEAINDQGGVYLVRDDVLVSARVNVVGETVRDDRSLTLIQSGEINDGDAIVVSQIPSARDGLRVTIRDDG